VFFFLFFETTLNAGAFTHDLKMGAFLQYFLPVWSAIGVYTILGLMQVNGTFKDLSAVESTGVYPKSNVLARNDFTGIEGLDNFLRTLNVTFWPIIDGSFPAASLHCFQFAGAFGVTWIVLLLESVKSGNQGKAISLWVPLKHLSRQDSH